MIWQHTDEDGDRASLHELVNLGRHEGEYRLSIQNDAGESLGVDIPLDDLLRLRDVLEGL